MFSDSIVVITGAAGNLGQATAEAFMKGGARCVLIDKNSGALRTIYGERKNAHVAAIDLSDREALAECVKKYEAEFGRADVLCNIAGGFVMGHAVHDTPLAELDGMIDINVRSIFNAAHAIVPSMLARGGGRIINVGAGAALRGPAHAAAYSVAKSAVLRTTESMSAELREQGINVNCVLPSIIDTPSNRAAMPNEDHGRWVVPAALADVILFLASPAARAIHGAAIPVVGLSGS